MALQDARTELPTDHHIHLYDAFKGVRFMGDVLGERAKTDLLLPTRVGRWLSL